MAGAEGVSYGRLVAGEAVQGTVSSGERTKGSSAFELVGERGFEPPAPTSRT